MSFPLRGKVAVVAGATRGCGRGIAVELGALGATVYVAGRSTRGRPSPMRRPETIEQTAKLVDAAGGRGIPVRCDFTSADDVRVLASRIESDTGGSLDVLVNDVWGGDPLHEMDTEFWRSNVQNAIAMVRNGVESHLISLHELTPLLIRNGRGLVVEVTDGDNDDYVGAGVPYYLVKCAVRALGRSMADELRSFGVTALSVTPGFLRSEAMLEGFGVTERNWRDAADPHFAMSETPRYIGRGIAALATDENVARFSGNVLSSWALMREYGFTDIDGSQPDWGRWYDEVVRKGTDPTSVDVTRFR